MNLILEGFQSQEFFLKIFLMFGFQFVAINVRRSNFAKSSPWMCCMFMQIQKACEGRLSGLSQGTKKLRIIIFF